MNVVLIVVLVLAALALAALTFLWNVPEGEPRLYDQAERVEPSTVRVLPVEREQ